MSLADIDMLSTCPCGTEKAYNECCNLFLSNQKIPSSPEELMRSRYTAYFLHNIDYIARTMKSPAADGFDAASTKEWARKIKWKKLQIVNSSQQGNRGRVEFIAYYEMNHKQHRLHEISEFHFENDQWYYVDGMHPSVNVKIGRNDPCLCGSNKKYKKCCGNTS